MIRPVDLGATVQLESVQLNKFLIILEEVLIAFGIAVSLGTWASADLFIYGYNPLNILQPIAASVIWLAPALLSVWLLELLLVSVGRRLEIDSWNRKEAVKASRPLYLTYLSVLQPALTYSNYTLPILLLCFVAVLWRSWSIFSSSSSFREKADKLEQFLLSTGDLKIALAVATAFFCLYTVIIAGAFGPRPQPEGDEPHYLTTAYSIITDGDLELSNNYSNQDFRRWHAGWIQAHTKAGKGGMSEQYSMHNSGLPVYIAPFLALGLLADDAAVIHFIVRIGIILTATVFLALLYRFLAQNVRKRTVALAVTILAASTVPILFHSHHIFSELPVAMLLMLAIFLLWRETSPGIAVRILLGVALGALPFLGVKYFALVLPFLIFWIIRELKWGFRFKRVLAVAIPGILLALLFLWQTYTLYGTFSPSAYYLGTSNPLDRNYLISVSHASDLLDALVISGKAALSYLIGQRESLIFYAPWYLLSFFGIYKMIRSGGESRALAVWLIILALPYFALNSVTDPGGGHSPPGRVILPIIWFFIIPTGWALAKGLKRGREIFAGLVILSLSIAIILLVNPGLLYHDFQIPSSRLLAWISSPFLDLVKLFPSISNKHFENIGTTLIWAGVCIGTLSLFSLRKQGEKKDQRNTFAGVAPLTIALLVLLWAFLAKTPPLQPEPFSTGDDDIYIWFERGEVFTGPEAFWVKTGKIERCYLIGPHPIQWIEMRFRSIVPNKVVIHEELYRSTLPLIERKNARGVVRLVHGFSWLGLHVSCFSIESTSGVPEGKEFIEGDSRPLGIEVRVIKLNQ